MSLNIIYKAFSGVTVLAIGLVACFAVSCTKQAGDEAVKLEEIREIAFTAEVASSSTKAVPVVSLSDFYVSATQGSAGSETSAWNDVAFTLDHGFFVGNRFWPEDMDPVYHFYGSNAHISFEATGSTIDADNSRDIVCAYLPSSTYMSTNALSFEHVFARIGNVTVSAAEGYALSSVSMSIVPKTGGTYNLRTGFGRTDGTGWSDMVNGSSTVICNDVPGTKSNDIYLVPGDYTVHCEWTASEDDYTKSFSKDVVMSFVGGKVNGITVSLGGQVSQLVFGVELNEWTETAVNAGTFPII